MYYEPVFRVSTEHVCCLTVLAILHVLGMLWFVPQLLEILPEQLPMTTGLSDWLMRSHLFVCRPVIHSVSFELTCG